MVNVFLDKCLYSPFEFPEYRKKFEQRGIKLVRHARPARIIMSSYMNVLRKYTKLKGKRFILWTHEPYQDFHQVKKIKVDGNIVYIMNCYTKDVFTHNYRYFYFKTPLEYLEIDDEDQHTKMILRDSDGPKIVALSTYYNKGYYEKNPATLLPQRYEVILAGYSLGYLDLFGKDWEKYPNVISLGNSRHDSDRRKSKGEILQSYWFNICLENALAPFYITEKIWEAIKWGCLPIYYSNDTIYQTFEPGSFIDYKEFLDRGEGVMDLYNYLEHMTVAEYKERMNLCIKAYNKVIQTGKNNKWRGKSSNPNINYLEYESCYRELVKKIEKL